MLQLTLLQRFTAESVILISTSVHCLALRFCL